MLEIIQKTGIFLILSETIYHFMNDNQYARYVRLLIRLMTMTMIVLPVLGFFSSTGSDTFLRHLKEYEESYFAGINGVESAGADVMEIDSYVYAGLCEDISYLCSQALQGSGMAVEGVSILENRIHVFLTGQALSADEAKSLCRAYLGVSKEALEVVVVE